MLIRCSRTINASPAIVFACVDQPDHIVGWVGGVIEHAYLTERGSTSAVGQRFRQRLRQGRGVRTFHGEIIAWEPVTHFALRIPAPAYTSEAHFRISSDGPGVSRIDYSIEVALHSLSASVLGPLLRLPLNVFVRMQIDRLKRYAETVEHAQVTRA